MSSQDTSHELELIAATVHELKAPLTLIHGMGAMLESESPGKLDSRQQEQLQQIRKASHRLNSLVESLLHIENLPYMQHAQPVQIHSELHTVMEETKPLTRERNVTLAWRPRKTLPPVLADPVSTYQLLSHAITAVVKHSPSGAEVVVRTRRRGSMIVLHIDAPGEPITPSEAHRITEVLGKHLQPVRGYGDSAGLSWYIVKSIVEFYEGSLKVSPGSEYTTITLRLPVSNQLSLFS